MPTDTPLTPEAAAVVAAFDAVMDRAGVFEGATDALAAALRELAAVMEKAVPSHCHTECSHGYRQSTIDTIAGVRAIADSIENAITYAPVEPPTNA